MELETLIEAVVLMDHGSAVADQFKSSFQNHSFEDENDNALELIQGSCHNVLNSGLLHDEYDLQSYVDALEDYLGD